MFNILGCKQGEQFDTKRQGKVDMMRCSKVEGNISRQSGWPLLVAAKLWLILTLELLKVFDY